MIIMSRETKIMRNAINVTKITTVMMNASKTVERMRCTMRMIISMVMNRLINRLIMMIIETFMAIVSIMRTTTKKLVKKGMKGVSNARLIAGRMPMIGSQTK